MKMIRVRALPLFFAAFNAFLFLPLTPLWAQGLTLPDTDIFAPIIQHTPGDAPVRAGETLTLKASVTDDIGVTEVTLFYRKPGAVAYSSINMESVGGKTYSATISREEVAGPKVEYYIQAFDKAGNTSMRGFAFEPLTLTVLAPPPIIDEPLEKVIVEETLTPKEEAPKILTEEVFPEETVEIVPQEREPFALRTEKAAGPSKPEIKKPWHKKWWVWTIALAVIGGAAAAGGGGGGGGKSAGAKSGSVTFSGGAP